MKYMNVTGRIVSVAVAVSATATLVGCGSSGHNDKASSPKSTPTSNKSVGKITGNKAPKFVGVQHPIPKGKALDNVPDKYKYVHQTGCSAIPGGWKAIGTAQNATGKSQTFQVLVFFTDAQARIVDSATATVSVPSNSKGTWTAERQFKAPKGTLCVVRAVS